MADDRPATLAYHVDVRGDSAAAAPEAPRADARLVAEAAGGATAGHAERLAVLVTHGMGQQIPFVTLDSLLEPLLRHQEFAGAERTADVVLFGGKQVRRVAVRLPDHREIHFYEGYWAPLTEGVVRLRDVTGFLLRTGMRGMLGGGRFHRWTFGECRAYDVPLRTWAYIVVALGFVCALVAINAVIGAVLGARFVLGGQASWLTDAVLADLTVTVNIVLIAAVAVIGAHLLGEWAAKAKASPRTRRAAGTIGVIALTGFVATTLAAGVALPALVLAGAGPDGDAAKPRHLWDVIWGAGSTDALNRGCGWLISVLAAAGVLAALGYLVIHFWRMLGEQLQRKVTPQERQQQPFASKLVGWLLFAFVAGLVAEGVFLYLFARGQPRGVAGPALVWPLLMLVSYGVRRILVQYVGDVAAYVSSHTIDRFAELREKIQTTVCELARAIYGAGRGREYDGVYLVGHSLGSVVTYDVLNRLINEDELHRQQGERAIEVVKRTRLLLTFGSPLDKTAFLFATQTKHATDTREALAAAVQPLIQRYDLRPARWINIYSPWDIVSGALDYYDDPDGRRDKAEDEDPRRIKNVPDDDASVLLAAHVQYWANPCLIDTTAHHLLHWDADPTRRLAPPDTTSAKAGP